jgi:hypothetical protein
MLLHITKITLNKVDHYFLLKLISKVNINMKPTLIAKSIISIILLVNDFICHHKFFPWNDNVKRNHVFSFHFIVLPSMVNFQLQNLRLSLRFIAQ